MIDKNKLRRALQDYMKERLVEDTKILEEKKGQAYYIDGKKTIILVCGGGFSGEEVKYCEGTGGHQHVLRARRGLCHPP